MKYGFHAVLFKYQLDKVYGIFKKENLKIKPENISYLTNMKMKLETKPNQSSRSLFMPEKKFLERIFGKVKKDARKFRKIKWETVGRPNKSSGNVFMPDHDFMENVDNFKKNKFLHIGKSQSVSTRVGQKQQLFHQKPSLVGLTGLNQVLMGSIC